MKKMLDKLLKHQKPQESEVKNFLEKQKTEEAFDYHKRGLLSVPLKLIVGSVRRYHDFDNKFRLKQHLPQERLVRIRNIMRAGKPLPPVDLFQIKDEYYVLDGNHRIAAAKEFGFKDITARIVECIPRKKTWENILYREQSAFYDKTSLPSSIKLTEAGQYIYLLKQISAHQQYLEAEIGKVVPFEKVALDWYNTIYTPFVSIIKQSRFLEYFPKRTVADFYAYISFHQWGNWRQKADGVETDELITKNMEEFRKKMAEKHHQDYSEMLRDITLFILLSIVTRKEEQIIKKLFQIEEVKEVHSVHGNIDILIKAILTRDLLSSDAEVIGRFVQDKVRKIPGIISSQTLIPSISKIKDTGRNGSLPSRSN